MRLRCFGRNEHVRFFSGCWRRFYANELNLANCHGGWRRKREASRTYAREIAMRLMRMCYVENTPQTQVKRLGEELGSLSPILTKFGKLKNGFQTSVTLLLERRRINTKFCTHHTYEEGNGITKFDFGIFFIKIRKITLNCFFNCSYIVFHLIYFHS